MLGGRLLDPPEVVVAHEVRERPDVGGVDGPVLGLDGLDERRVVSLDRLEARLAGARRQRHLECAARIADATQFDGVAREPLLGVQHERLVVLAETGDVVVFGERLRAPLAVDRRLLAVDSPSQPGEPLGLAHHRVGKVRFGHFLVGIAPTGPVVGGYLLSSRFLATVVAAGHLVTHRAPRWPARPPGRLPPAGRVRATSGRTPRAVPAPARGARGAPDRWRSTPRAPV